MGGKFAPIGNPRSFSGLAGLWEEVGNAIGRVWTCCNDAVNANTNWQGNRADKFRPWWDGTSTGLNLLGYTAMETSRALQRLYEKLAKAAGDLDDAAVLVRTSLDTYIESPTEIAGSIANFGGLADNKCLVQLTKDGLRVSVTQAPNVLSENQWPAKIREAKGLFDSARRKYNEAMNDAAKDFTEAKGDLDRVTQFPKIDPYDGWTFRGGALTTPVTGVPTPNDADPRWSRDPTWTELTGGGIFKPEAPGQFEEFDPNDVNHTRLVPSWYAPVPKDKTGETIRAWLDGASKVLDVAAIAVAILQPELLPEVAGLALINKSGQIITDLAADDNRDAILHGADIVLMGVGAQNLTGLIVKKAGVSEYGEEITKKVTEYVQSEIKDGATKNEKGETVISTQRVQEIMSEAQGRAMVLSLEKTPAGRQQ